MSNRYDLTIVQGETFNPRLLYMQPQLEVKTITGITSSGQAVVTAAAHGLTVDWPVFVVGVTGMRQINHKPADLKNAARAYQAYYVSANAMRLNVDTSGFPAYAAGGEMLYHPPVNLTGYTARLQVRETLEAAGTILSLTTENGGISLGGAAGTIDLLVSAADTAALDFETAVYDLELVSAGGVVTRIMRGDVVLADEVTR